MGLKEVRRGYRDETAAENYEIRFSGFRKSMNNRMVLRAVNRACGTPGKRSIVLDIPCGTGRLQEILDDPSVTKYIQADVSMQMLRMAGKKQELTGRKGHLVQCDITKLPFKDKTFRIAVNVRFMQHLDPYEREITLRELNRVSEKLVVCYYHKYTFKTGGRIIRRKLGIYEEVPVKASRADLLNEAAAAELQVERIRQVFPLFSDNWVVELRGAPESTG